MTGRTRVGIGGWTYAPWRGAFYPDTLTQKDELHFASRAVTAIEINGTFYRTQSPESFRKWAQDTPDDFVFSLKAHRFVTNRKVLAEAGPSIERFLDSGLLELGSKLGPILWQMSPFKRFDAADIEAFLGLLPKDLRGHRLRHVIEVRHESFRDAAFVALARKHNVAICLDESDEFPMISDVTADFVYARLLRARETIESGYPDDEIARWAGRVTTWASGGVPDDLSLLSETPQRASGRDCFIYMINGAKVRAPAAARALLVALGQTPRPLADCPPARPVKKAKR